MSNIQRAIGWAVAILFVALAGNVGLIAPDVARTLIIILPILALTSQSRSAIPCRLFARREG